MRVLQRMQKTEAACQFTTSKHGYEELIALLKTIENAQCGTNNFSGDKIDSNEDLLQISLQIIC